MKQVKTEKHVEFVGDENYHLSLISGGSYSAPPGWQKELQGPDHCYKFYFPSEGTLQVTIGDQIHSLQGGHIYYLNGYRVGSEACPAETGCTFHWLHFLPDSLYLSYLLSHMPPIHGWDLVRFAAWREVISRLHKVFDDPYAQHNRLVYNSSAALISRIYALMLLLVSHVLEENKVHSMEEVAAVFLKLKPAIDYMNHHYLEGPKLKQVAGTVHLAPNYFHRLFTQTFGMTPHDFMLQKRLNLARQLLASTDYSVKQIAARVGYNNEYYFSRVFKEHLDLSPTAYRKREQPRPPQSAAPDTPLLPQADGNR